MTNCDVEGEVTLSVGEIAACGSFDAFCDKLADGIGHPLLTEVDYEVIEIVDASLGKIKLKVTGCIEVEDGEVEDPEAEQAPGSQGR
jgi:hypothetical protein